MKNNFTVKTKLLVKNATIINAENLDKNRQVSIFNKYQQKYVDRYIQELEIKIKDEYLQKLKIAEEEAFLSGQKAGLDNANLKYEADIKHAMRLFDTAIDTIKQEYKNLIKKTEKDILQLILAISKKIINTEIKISNDVILNTLRKSLQLISKQKKIVIYVNKQDLDIVQKSVYSLGATKELPEQIEITACDDIATGGCRVAYETGSIDADINTQFEEISRQLLENEL